MPLPTLHIIANNPAEGVICSAPTERAWFQLNHNQAERLLSEFSGRINITDQTLGKTNVISQSANAQESKALIKKYFYAASTGIESLGDKSICRNPVVSVTSHCNLRCSYCYMGMPSLQKYERGHLSTQTIFKFIDEVIRLGENETNTVQFFGGEPTVHPEIEKLIDFGLKRGLYVRISTNGMASKIRSDKLSRHTSTPNVEWRVSLDSHVKEDHERYRGKGTYDRVLKNLEYLKNTGANVSLKTVLHSKNIKTFEDYLEFANGYKFKVAYGLLAHLGEASKNKIERQLTTREVVETIIEIYSRKPYLIDLLGPSPFGRMIRSLYVKNTTAFPRLFPYLHSDGVIYPMDELVRSEFAVGKGFSIDSKKLAQLNKTLFLKKTVCEQCSIEPFCYRGSYGSLYERDPSMDSEFDSCVDKRETYSILMNLKEVGADMARRMYSGDSELARC